MWDKSTLVYFSKANQIAQAQKAKAICCWFIPNALEIMWLPSQIALQSVQLPLFTNFPKSKTLAAYASTFEIENPCRLSTQMLPVVLVESSPLWRNEITATFLFFFSIKNNVSCRISYFSFSGNPQIGEREAKSFLRRTNVVV